MNNQHMRRREKEITDVRLLDLMLERGRYCTIALCRQNEPYCVTMNYGYNVKRKCLYFHCAKEGEKLDFITVNPRVCATIIEDCGYDMGACDHHYRSIVLRGTIERVIDKEEMRVALDTLISHLELFPEEVSARMIRNDSDKLYQSMTFLRLDIEQISGKQSL